MFVLALLSICYCAGGTYHAVLVSCKTGSPTESASDERYVTKNAKLPIHQRQLAVPCSSDPQMPYSFPLVEQLPYSAGLGARLRESAVAASRPVWLRLASGAQELFAAWPEHVIRLETGALQRIGRSGIEALPGGVDALWNLIRDGLPACTSGQRPFHGGWLGSLSYDLGTRKEPGSLTFPDVLLANYRCFIWIDHEARVAELVTVDGFTGSTDDWRVLTEKAISQTAFPDTFSLLTPFQPMTSRSRYAADFARIQTYLHAGDCYQVNYAQAFHARCAGQGAIAMRHLLALSRASHAAWMLAPEGEVLCLSPELFLSIRNGRVLTKPIKGTAPRNADPVLDQRNRMQLAQSQKNQAENLMIVDLLRHDLGRHAKTGTVRVERLFDIESLPQVHHMVSSISAEVSAGSDAIDVIRDCFPGGSITGAPKKRAMEIIAELEPTSRSIYCGSIGFITAGGDTELNIAIRTLLRLGGDMYTWAGGGIVADSDCDAEYQECFDKMGALMRALEDGE